MPKSAHFKQVNFILPPLDLTRIHGGQLHEGYGDVFRSYEILDIDYLLTQVHTQLRFHEPPLKITYVEVQGPGTPPHSERDSPVPTVLNYYLETAQDLTQFWHTKHSATQGDHIPVLDNQGWLPSPIQNYCLEDLKLVGCFMARPNTAYLLDVACIHSVAKSNDTAVRKFIRFGWHDLTVDQVYRSIELLPTVG
jgi:hypothetical protein